MGDLGVKGGPGSPTERYCCFCLFCLFSLFSSSFSTSVLLCSALALLTKRKGVR